VLRRRKIRQYPILDGRPAEPRRRVWLVKLSKPGQMFGRADANPANVG